MYRWNVEQKTVAVRTNADLGDLGLYDENGKPLQDKGYRYRYVCTCGHRGPWRRDPNLADGDEHLYRHYA